MSSSPSIPPIVSFDGVSKKYGDGPLILDDINMSVNKGEFISLIGPSGCGKSTVLKLISGLAPITEGTLTVDGMTPENAREEMAFVFQEPTLLPWKTVEKNVETLLKLRGVGKDRRAGIASQMINLVGLDHAPKHFPRQLSGGMRMRVSIARALSVSPKIILMDEPFGALDEMTRDRLNEDLLEIRAREEFTAFFVTHSVAEAVFLSTRIVVLSANPGRIHEIIEVPFQYPRTEALRDRHDFHDLVIKVSQSLRSVEESAHAARKAAVA
ncbi:MAG: ABC transporter ATP-binding protein [Verrucomicrobiota bacterium]